MTIAGWIGIGVICFAIICGCGYVLIVSESANKKIAAIILAIILCAATISGFYWYFNFTASGQRALTDERSDLSNGLERTVTIYTANGDIIAQYEGKIDLEMDQDYVKFDWEGKRYIYYNCFVETIAIIP